MATISTQQITI